MAEASKMFITILDASRILGQYPQCIREGIEEGRYDYGQCLKVKRNGRISKIYCIDTLKFWKYAKRKGFW